MQEEVQQGGNEKSSEREQDEETHLISSLGNSNRGRNLGGSSSIHDSVVNDQVSDDTDGVVKSSLSLVDDLQDEARGRKMSSSFETRLRSPAFTSWT